MVGAGFTIYGKVTDWNPGSKQAQIVTSTIMEDRSRAQAAPIEMPIEKIEMKDVPEKARSWILARISNPSDPPSKTPLSLQASDRYQDPVD